MLMLKAKRGALGSKQGGWGWTLTGALGLLCLAGMGYMLTGLIKQEAANNAVKTMDPALKARVALQLDPELMQFAPPAGQFDEGIKNHCWYVEKPGAAKELRCLPYWYIAGSFQAGAENLLYRVKEHPDVITNEATRWHFWAEDNKKTQGYINHIAKSHAEILKDPKNKVVLDASASTMAFYWSASLRTHRAFQNVMVPCWRECSEGAKGNETKRESCMETVCFQKAMANDRAVAEKLGVGYEQIQIPLLMSALYGQVKPPKLVFLLRNPTERLHSAFWNYDHYQTKYGKTPQGFLAYATEQIGELKACEAKPGFGRTPEGCALLFEALGLREEKLFFHADQIIRGMYALYMEHWLAHFPRQNILIIKSEEYFKDPEATVKQVFDFVGLSQPTDPKVWEAMTRAGKPKASHKQDMTPEARKLVTDFYRPWNERLAQVLNDPYYKSWNQSP